MTTSIKPVELNWLTPYLAVGDAQKAVEFYTEVFGFAIHQLLADKKGHVIFARLTYKGCNFIIAPHEAFENEHPGHPPSVAPTLSPLVLYVYCDNLDQRYQKAVEYGLKILMQPVLRFWGDRMFRVVDPEGYIWDFASREADFNPNLLPSSLRD
jgi:uncharacterized glyoxalase superfamily protein PhnB